MCFAVKLGCVLIAVVSKSNSVMILSVQYIYFLYLISNRSDSLVLGLRAVVELNP
jgi:hypothetical protein